MKKTNLIIDTDMGVDDIMAISMLIQSPQFSIKAISTVFGVSTAKNGAINLDRIFLYLRKKFPIYEGMDSATKSDWKETFPATDCFRANRLTLLNQVPIPQVKNKLPYNNLDSLYRNLQQENVPLCLVCLGPLTNIAYLINRYGQKFTRKINRIVMMGGAVTQPGNVPPLKKAEYNIYLDPEAARTVFGSNIQITLIPIDATKWVPASTSFTNQVKECLPQTKAAKVIQAIITNNNADFDNFYDPLVSAIMIDSSIIQERLITNLNVAINGPNRGQTCVAQANSNNVIVVTKVNAEKFYQRVMKSIR